MADDIDWLQLLRLGASIYGGVSGGFGGVGLPDAGAGAAAAAPVAAPVPPIPPDITMPAGTSLPPPAAVTPRAVVPPPADLPTPPIPPGAAPTPFTSNTMPNIDDMLPGPTTKGYEPPGWWKRNIGDPLDKAFTVDPKAPAGTLSPGMKALQGVGSLAGKLGTAPAAAAPAIAAGGGGGGYRPTGSINASQNALAREQARQMLMQRATLNAPWLKQRLQGGLMG